MTTKKSGRQVLSVRGILITYLLLSITAIGYSQDIKIESKSGKEISVNLKEKKARAVIKAGDNITVKEMMKELKLTLKQFKKSRKDVVLFDMYVHAPHRSLL